MKIAIITTHPIQYNAPFFVLLNERANIDLKVFYTWGPSVLESKFDPGFKRTIEWDIPLLDSYQYELVPNVARDKGSHHFNGIDNPDLPEQIQGWGAQAILVYGWAFKSHLKLMRYFKNKIPVLFRGDSTLLDEQTGFNVKKFLRRSFLRWVYSYADYALYVGTANKEYFKALGLKENQLIFVPHAVDNKRFRNENFHDSNEFSSIRKTLSIPTNSVVLLFAGKLEEKKNPFIVGQAMEILANKDLHLIYVGNGKLEHSLKERFEHNKNIHFVDFQNQLRMPFIYADADIFVLPSQGPGETWGLAVNEAMACGKAIIVSSCCGCATDLVKDGENGYVFKNGDVQDLTQKIQLMSTDQKRLKRMGEQSQKMISQWNFEAGCDAIEKILLRG